MSLAYRLSVVAFAASLSVEGDVLHLHRSPPEQYGRVRIAVDVGEGVVLAVDGGPLARSDAGRDPDEHPEREPERRAHGQRLVGQCPVQEDRRDEVGEHRHGEPGDEPCEEGDQHGATIAASTYWSVGSRIG